MGLPISKTEPLRPSFEGFLRRLTNVTPAVNNPRVPTATPPLMPIPPQSPRPKWFHHAHHSSLPVVAAMVGAVVGETVVITCVDAALGVAEGAAVGIAEGSDVGDPDGAGVGDAEGPVVGLLEGTTAGAVDGYELGVELG